MSAHQKTYDIINGFTLRAPLISLNFYFDLTKKKEINDEDLIELLKNPLINESLFIASPEFHRQLTFWLERNTPDISKKEKLKRIFLKYLIRMSTRSTPFGLFAGCTYGNFAETTNIILKPIDQYRRKTRLDMHFLISLALNLSKNDKIKQKLHWYSNNSLYKVADQWRFIEYSYKDGNRVNSLQAITSFDLLDEIIDLCRQGRTIDQLHTHLRSQEINIDEAKSFINSLIENQILVSSLEPSLTGKEYLDEIIETVQNTEGFESYVEELCKLKNEIAILNDEVLSTRNQYDNIIQSASSLDIAFNTKYLTQTDLFLQTDQCQLAKKWKYKLLKCFKLFNKITKTSFDSHLDTFKLEFQRRYGEREVPLVEALDNDVGIGFPANFLGNEFTPFLEELHFPEITKSELKITWDPFTSLLNELVQIANNQNEQIIDLKDSDLNKINNESDDLPDTMFAKAQFTYLDGSEKILVESINGRSAANLISRFCYGDGDIHHLVSEICNIESINQKNKDIAEIIHISSDRIGNVLRRPVLRKYEIAYLAKSGVPKDNQINIGDILISLRNKRIKLRSKHTGREIIPYLTNAHDFSNSSLPIYRFLCFLGNGASRSRISFDWQHLDTIYHDLPRIEYDGIIISKARWIINKSHIEKWYDLSNDEKALLSEVTSFRKKRRIPQFVSLGDSDNILAINLQNIDSIKIFLSEVKTTKWIVLEEFIYKDGQTPVKNESSESFSNEFILCFYKTDAA